MTVVRCRCPECGCVDVDLAQVEVVVPGPDLDRHPGGVMVFLCGRCGRVRLLPLSEHASRLLLHAGAALVGRPSRQPAHGSR